jgi:hypothetical protein
MPAVAGRHASSPRRRLSAGAERSCCEPLEPRSLLAADLPAPPFVPFDGPPLYQLSATGSIASAAEVDPFPLGRLRAGEVVTVSVSGAGSSRGTLGDPLVVLCRVGANPAVPTRVSFNDDDGSGHDALLYRFVVAAEDEYIAQVRSADEGSLGTYELAAWLERRESEPPAGAAWRAVTQVSRGGGAVGAGGAGAEGWAYDLLAGDLVTVVVHPTSSLDAAVTVSGPGGGTVAADLGDNGNFLRDARDALVFALPVARDGRYVVRVRGNGTTSGSYDATVDLSREPPRPPAEVVGRHLFYNHSAYDGRSDAAGPEDDAAVATDRAALLPGQVPTAANFTGYALGINGLMVDVLHLRGDAAPDDFAFELNVPEAPGAWAPAPAPAQITRRPGAGEGGTDRVTVTWADGAIVDRWLRVTVRATDRTGLAADDVFLFGNLAGDCDDGVVQAGDVLRARAARSDRAALTDPCDFNRDGRVNGVDVAVARARVGRRLTLTGLWAQASVSAVPPPRTGTQRRRAYESGATIIVA